MRLPTLDCNIWIDEHNHVMYIFFEKKMTANQVLHKDTALAEDTKISSLTAEVRRRMMNTSELLPDSDRVKVINNFTQKMANSGYRLEQIRRIVIAGLLGYEKRVEASKLDATESGFRPLHENAKYSGASRARKKLVGKSSWFKDKKKNNKEPTTEEQGAKKTPSVGGDNNSNMNKATFRKQGAKKTPSDGMKSGSPNKRKRTEDRGEKRKIEPERKEWKKPGRTVKRIETTTVLFVDQTKGGILAKKIREQEDRLATLTGFRVKIVENGGSQLSQVFPTNPWAGQTCGRDECWTCKQGDKTPINCFSRNILYESHCSICADERGQERRKDRNEDLKGRKLKGSGIYVGESSRSLFERSQEHLADGVGKQKDSHMYKHWAESHPEENSLPHFKFKLISTYQDCLTRQISEAVRIARREEVLNSKSEFNRCRITRLTIEKTEWEQNEEARIAEEKREKQKQKRTKTTENSTLEEQFSTLEEHEDKISILGEEKLDQKLPEVEQVRRDYKEKERRWEKEETEPNRKPMKRRKKRGRMETELDWSENLKGGRNMKITDWLEQIRTKGTEEKEEKEETEKGEEENPSTLEEEKGQDEEENLEREKRLETVKWKKMEWRKIQESDKLETEMVELWDWIEPAFQKELKSRDREKRLAQIMKKKKEWKERQETRTKEKLEQNMREIWSWIEPSFRKELKRKELQRRIVRPTLQDGGKRKRYRKKGKWEGGMRRNTPREVETRIWRKPRSRMNEEKMKKDKEELWEWLEPAFRKKVERNKQKRKAEKRKENWEQNFWKMDWMDTGGDAEKDSTQEEELWDWLEKATWKRAE